MSCCCVSHARHPCVLMCRCTQLKNMTEDTLKECVRAASYRLHYPGVLKSAEKNVHNTVDAVVKPAAAATPQKVSKFQQLHGINPAGGQDYTDLHARFHLGGGRFENILTPGSVGYGYSAGELAGLSAVLLAVCMFAYWRMVRAKRHPSHKIQHRAD